MFKETTYGVTVTVMPVYIDERSNPQNSEYFWAYRVAIENNSGRTLQLMTRYWYITDSNGRIDEVRGDGVIGEQPFIENGQEYSYSSGCPLTAPSGIMVGHYTMQNDQGSQLEIAIPAFSLDLPDLSPSIN